MFSTISTTAFKSVRPLACNTLYTCCKNSWINLNSSRTLIASNSSKVTSIPSASIDNTACKISALWPLIIFKPNTFSATDLSIDPGEVRLTLVKLK